MVGLQKVSQYLAMSMQGESSDMGNMCNMCTMVEVCHTALWVFGVLVIVGLVTQVILLSKILQAHRTGKKK